MALERSPENGDIYQREDGSLYRVIGYQPNPTIILERITGPDGSQLKAGVNCPQQNGRAVSQETHAIGCLNAEQFNKIGTFHRERQGGGIPFDCKGFEQ